MCWSRPETVTSTEAGPGQWPLQEQDQDGHLLEQALARDPNEGATSEGASLSQQPWDQAQARDVCRNSQLASDLNQGSPKPATSMETGPRQQTPLNQAQDSNLCSSRPETGTPVRAGPSQWPLQEQVGGSSPREQTQASDLHGSRPKWPPEFRVTSGNV